MDTHESTPPPAIALAEASTTDGGLPIAPSLSPTLAREPAPPHATLIDAEALATVGWSMLIGIAAAFVAEGLTRLIWLITNLSFHGKFLSTTSSFYNASWPVILLVPILGGIVVGLMSRYGSKEIRGHGIPEAIEKVLLHESRIPARVTFLKPLSAAVAIGTGGPFGMEGPIIATGGALGSLVGQLLGTSASQRKTLLAAGAAAGMAATFGTPISAVLLAVELLLFEMRARSLTAVALAASLAAGARHAIFHNSLPVFPMPGMPEASTTALLGYALLGAIIGLASVGVTRAVYAAEDGFAKLPIHWMWWPAIGAVVIGVVGCVMPRTLGVGYDNITDILDGHLAVKAVLGLSVLKFISWSISLASGTSGGTLAPLFTIGGAAGAALGAGAAAIWPGCGIDWRIAGLVGMAAMFAGASRAMLTSIVFALEATWQTTALGPLLGGCAAAFLVSCLLMPETIMTLKVTRRGVRVPSEYEANPLDHVLVRQLPLRKIGVLEAKQTVAQALQHLAGDLRDEWAIVNDKGVPLGIVDRRELAAAAKETLLANMVKQSSDVVNENSVLRKAMEKMLERNVERLAVIPAMAWDKTVAVLGWRDLLVAQHLGR